MSYNCCVAECENTNVKNNSSSFYNGKFIRIPDNAERRDRWNTALNLSGSKKRYICSEHFTADAWRMQDVIMNVPTNKRKLKPDAIPTIKKKSSPAKSVDIPDLKSIVGSYQNPILCHKNSIDTHMMDEKTRKRLVDEALASYEENLQKEKSDTNIKRKCAKRKCSTMIYESNEYETDDIDCDVCGLPEYNSSLIKQKCGEIFCELSETTTLLNFTLNCLICSKIYSEINTFAEHIIKQHGNLFKLENAKSNELSIYNENVKVINDLQKQSDNFADHQQEHQQMTSNFQIENQELNSINHKLMIRIIEKLKREPVLWSKSHEDYKNTQQRKMATTRILNGIKFNFPNTNFTHKILSKLLQKLRLAYRKHVQVSKNQENYIYKPKYWFINELKFFDCIEMKNSFENLMRLLCERENSIMELIELYEKQPSLWNFKNSNYKGKLKNSIELNELYCKVKKADLTLELGMKSDKELDILLNDLNCWFSKQEFQSLHKKREDKQEQDEEHNDKKQNINFQFELHYKNNKNNNNNSAYGRLHSALEFLRGHVAPFHCFVCDTIFHNESQYLIHIQQRIDQSNTTSCKTALAATLNGSCSTLLRRSVFECTYCGKRFPRAPNLRHHIRQHTDERPYECSLCTQRFRNYSTWFRHRRTHTKLKPFQCSDCQRCFYTNSLLQLHLKSHLGIRDKCCDICGKTFTLAKYLYRHRMTHLRAKADQQKQQLSNFQCEFCLHNSFKTRTALQDHRKHCSSRHRRREVRVVKKVVQQKIKILTDQRLSIIENLRVQSLPDVQSNQVKTIMKLHNNRSIVLHNMQQQKK